VKKFIIVVAVLAFSALAFGDDTPTAPTGDAVKTTDTTKTTDTKTTDAMGKKTAKKTTKKTHKAKKAATTDDKAM
jgi:hypothetical protein